MNYEKNKKNIFLSLNKKTLVDVFELKLKDNKERIELRREIIKTLKSLRNLNRRQEHYKKILFKKGGKSKWFQQN